VTKQEGNTVITEQANELNQLTGTTGGGTMRFAGTLSKPGTVTVGGNTATMSADNLSFEGYATVPAGTTTPVHIVATDGGGTVTDKYTNVTPDTVTSQAFGYDLNGNTTSSGPSGAPTAIYGWDAADRLISVTQGTNVTTYDYDGAGRRVREWLNGTETRHWIWCGLQLCEERDSSNNVTKRFYPQGEQISGTAYCATRDHLGSIRELVDGDGVTLHARYEYGLYGTRSANQVTIGAIESDFGFTGHQEFTAIGLVGAPLRFYQPQFARWLSRDPIEEDGGINLYGYAGNNPVSWIDPLGLAVYVGEHTVLGLPSVYHLVIVLQPDNPSAFADNPLFINNLATLGGEPTGKFPNLGNLAGKPNYDGDKPCKLKNLRRVPTPPGMTDSQFIQALINAANSYQNNLPYAGTPFPGSAYYNSNGYVSGVLQAAGGTPPSLPGIQPGYDQPIPLHK
jgi:RHS repeat-associated protein